MIFYKANKVGKPSEIIQNCDNQIAADISTFSDTFTDVLQMSLKPVVDFVVYSVELSRVQGLATPLTLYSWFACAYCVSMVTMPAHGLLAVQKQQLEGQFRGLHSRLVNNCEQVAFVGGEVPEKKLLNGKLDELLTHLKDTASQSFNSEIVTQYLNKYFVTVIGLALASRPVRLGLNGMDQMTSDQLSEYFVSTWRNMEAMSTSIQDLFELSNRIGTLTGFSFAVNNLMDGLETRPAVLQAEIEQAKAGPNPPVLDRTGSDMQFKNVTVYKPDGTALAKKLTFNVEKGQRILVTGSNGCGKSSLFRIMRGLWPLVSGSITMPPAEEIYYATQVNYVPEGTLRDLVTYPLGEDDFKNEQECKQRDERVKECLEMAQISPFVTKKAVAGSKKQGTTSDPFDTKFEKEYNEKFGEAEVGKPQLEFSKTENGELIKYSPGLDDKVPSLSPGQQQKLAFARLFYHDPKFVILDECTNGTSPDVEENLYEMCHKMGMTIFSISHKKELKEFHDYELHYGEEGSWVFLPCSETRGKIL